MGSPENVVVVGGGPIGLVSALGLAQAGVPVTVIDRAAGVIASPRAIVYHWSVLEGIERLGLLEDALAVGFAKQDYTYADFRSGERIHYSIDVLEGHTAFPYNLHIGQHQLAEIALQRLVELPHAEVRWGTEFVGLEQDDTGVTVHTAGPDGASSLRAGWVIGADGASSPVRKALGLEFEGFTWPKRFVAVNLRYDFSLNDYARTTFLIDDQYGAVIAKLTSDGLWRCTYSEPLELPEETITERMPDYFKVILPGATDLGIDAFSPYRMHQRAAARFRSGRVLLAGDAAHATNPSGGYGLTSGLFDAFVLYDALAAVIRREASETVLDVYADERRRNFLEIVSPAATENKRVIFDTSDPAQREVDLTNLRRMASDKDVLLSRLMLLARMRTRPLVPTP